VKTNWIGRPYTIDTHFGVHAVKKGFLDGYEVYFCVYKQYSWSAFYGEPYTSEKYSVPVAFFPLRKCPPTKKVIAEAYDKADKLCREMGANNIGGADED
jgi:hypothetical protein